MMRIPLARVLIQSLLCGVVVALTSSCSTTGGSIGNLVPAPKFTKGKIENGTYTAPDGYFSIALPHTQASAEYAYMKIKEQYSADGAYVSFGPAALDRSIYRLEIGRRASVEAEEITLGSAADALISHYQQELSAAYRGEFRLEEKGRRTINRDPRSIFDSRKQPLPVPISAANQSRSHTRSTQ